MNQHGKVHWRNHSELLKSLETNFQFTTGNELQLGDFLQVKRIFCGVSNVYTLHSSQETPTRIINPSVTRPGRVFRNILLFFKPMYPCLCFVCILLMLSRTVRVDHVFVKSVTTKIILENKTNDNICSGFFLFSLKDNECHWKTMSVHVCLALSSWIPHQGTNNCKVSIRVFI